MTATEVKTMSFVRRNGPRKVVLDQQPIPEPGEHNVLIRTRFAGLCGSDLARYFGSDAMEKPIYDQIAYGHEFVGEVVELGANVSGDLIGKNFAVAPLVPCHRCGNCLLGYYAQCGSYSFIGSRQNGAFAEYVEVPAMNLVALPEGMPIWMGASPEPLANVLHPLMTSGWMKGNGTCRKPHTAAVIGQGFIGLLGTQVAKAIGADHVIATHTNEPRLEISRATGATHTVCSDKSSPDADDFSKTVETTGLADLVIEAAGTPKAILSALSVAAPHATVLMIGKPTTTVELSKAAWEVAIRKELQLKFSFQSHSLPWPGDEWRVALNWLSDGLVDVEPLIDNRVSLTEAPASIQQILDGQSKPIKTLISVD